MTHFSELIEPTLLQECVVNGYVSVKEHPQFLELKILNYTPHCQFEGYWNDCTELCRGIVVNSLADVVVARPFRKFFNLGTSGRPETAEENLPKGRPLVTEKADGSMGVGFYHANEWRIATRGSFSSDQAIWANGWYEAHAKTYGPFDWPEGHTPVFEIIYKENQIVVSYQFEGLVLLGLIEIATGREIGRSELEHWGNKNHIPVIKVFDKSLLECAAENLVNFEGYVLTYPNGLKIKLKQDTYLKLHRILTSLNPKAVWEMLAEHRDAEITALFDDDKIPAQFKAWLSGWVTHLRSRYAEIETEARSVFAGKPGGSRKDDALYFTKTAKHLAGVLFQMLDGKDYAESIFGMIRPKATDTFKIDGDE